MEKIRNVYLHNLRNDEHFQFVEFVLELVGEAGATVPGVEAQARALAAAHARENEALRKITRSALTAALAAAGRERAGVFRGMADTARAALHHFDHGARDAATRVGIVMDTYGNLAHISLVEATSATHNLLGELAAHRAADVAALGLGPWADELGRLNRRVERLLEERADEGAGRTPLVLKTVRTEVDAAYRALVEMVGARATVASPGADGAEAEVYDDFARRLNERVEMLAHAVSVRRGMARARRQREDEEAARAAGMDVAEWRAARKADRAGRN